MTIVRPLMGLGYFHLAIYLSVSETILEEVLNAYVVGY
jgi:hypothetical protein